PVAGEPAGVISLVMALLSFVESAPRAYRLKVGNADLFRSSTEPGTSPCNIAAAHWKCHNICCRQAAMHLKEKRCHTFLRVLASQKEHVVFDMLKIVGRHG